jgi:predicted nucleic acid-binding Zn ribbon protein
MSFKPVGSEIQGLLSEWLKNPESRRVVLQRTWERAVGESVCRHCRAVGFEDDVLTVEVTDSSWAPQLRAMSKELISKVNKALGKTWVRRIEWTDGGRPADVSGSAPRTDRG